MSEAFAPVDVIIAKRDGRELSDAQIDWVVDAYTRGAVADEQMSALAMAILLNGMNEREIVRWTEAMIASGTRMDFSNFDAPSVDKHSTGGVGDKITLPLVPIVAAAAPSSRNSAAAASATSAALGQDGIHPRLARAAEQR